MRLGPSGTDSRALSVAIEDYVLSISAAVREPKCIAFSAFSVLQGPVVWRADNAIRKINSYPVDSVIHASNNRSLVTIYGMGWGGGEGLIVSR